MSNPNETQVGGSHYQAEFQHWDFATTVLMGRYLEGNITKYLRWRKKNGLQDLKKAVHYLDKLISVAYVPSSWSHLVSVLRCRWTPCYISLKEAHGKMPVAEDIEAYCDAQQFDHEERQITRLVADWAGLHDLEAAKHILEGMIEREQGIVDEIESMRQDNP